MLLASCNACKVRMWLRQYFFAYWKKAASFQTLKNKIGELTDMIGFGEFLSLFLESLSVVTMHYVYYLQVWMNCDIASMFTKIYVEIVYHQL